MRTFLTVIITVIFIAALFTVFIAGKNIFVKRLIEKGIKSAVGLDITIKDLDVSPFGTHLKIEGLTVNNPEGFEEREMVYIPQIMIVCDPVEYLRNKKIYFYLFDINVQRLTIVKNKEGRVNIKEIACLEDEPGGEGNSVSFDIEILKLTLTDIYYINHQHGSTPLRKKYHVNIKDAMFSKVDSSEDIVRLVVLRVLSDTEIGRLINMSVVPLASDLHDVVSLTGKTVEASVRGFLNVVTMPFRIIFGRHSQRE